MYEIVVDLFGGDNPIEELVFGLIEPLNAEKELEIVLTGDEKRLITALTAANVPTDRITIIDAPDVLTNSDNPMLAVKSDKRYSVSAAFDYYKNSNAAALVTVGNTGAVIVSALIKLGLAHGVTKPVLASALPCGGSLVCLCDCGANLEASAEDLLLFATLGAKYMLDCRQSASPRVALLSVGSERGKGSAAIKAAYDLFEGSSLRFVGNIEPAVIFTGKADVVVCDGLVGNMILKNTEAVGSRLISSIASLCDTDTYERIRSETLQQYSFNELGGAVVLGTNKYVIKAHGQANRKTINSCIMQGYSLINIRKEV